MEQTDINNIHLYCSDAMKVYDKWKSPVAIICDGPYGVNGFPGDLVSYNGLAEWYEPHIKKWSEFSTPLTTLWFWCTEVGWATVHPVLEKYGWEYVSCCVWDKGMSHVAGNTNTKTIRHALCALTVAYTIERLFPATGSIIRGLNILENVFSKLCYTNLCQGKEWLDHLEIKGIGD